MKRIIVVLLILLVGAFTWGAFASERLPRNGARAGSLRHGRTADADRVRRLQSIYQAAQLPEGTYLGAELCMACHSGASHWRDNAHAAGLRRPMARYSLVPGRGVVADADHDGVDDFQQGLDFNQVSSVFDPYKPDAPILSVENGIYYITIGENRMPVTVTVGGTGRIVQQYLVRVPVTDSPDGLSTGNYVSPVEFDERTGQYDLYDPGAWYDEGTGLPRFDGTTTSSELAAGNPASFSRNCSDCHAAGVEDLHQTPSGEWTYTPSRAALFSLDDPSIFDYNHDGQIDVVNIQCESCHGPGSDHVTHRGDPTRIVNPSDLTAAQADELCSRCHAAEGIAAADHPAIEVCPGGAHHETQDDVAGELAEERAGQTPEEVVHGDDAENCIACHGPTAVLANDRMSEVDALDYFFTSEGGRFTADTSPDHPTEWPSVSCTACHDSHSSGTPALFDSSTRSYLPVEGTSQLCGQCHGTLRFPDTDHQTYDHWAAGAHGDTQGDVAGELAEERWGETPEEVVHGDDPENCIACHGPTAVLAGGGMSEVDALDHFFTTEDGRFTQQTAPMNETEWPDVSCIACHDQHDPATPAYFDSSTRRHETMPTSELCGQCHGTLRFPDTDHQTYDHWAAGPHADTQADVAGELAEERAGETPEEVVHGPDAENCVACHGPTAVLAGGGMSEVEALDYFFTTSGGVFTADTVARNDSEWPEVSCTACHEPHSPAEPAYFDSSTGEHEPMGSSEVCGQCHGSLRFADTDHRTYDAWSSSKHSRTQADVADELAEERAGETPEEVVHGGDPENCIACHGPTAVRANGGMSEVEALDYFFSTTNGVFTVDTVARNDSEWPDVSCTACHEPHDPVEPAYFNSETGEYEPMEANQLCGQCHGSLRFPDTDHLSYDILSGSGGIGVDDQQTMPGATCIDCHMFSSDVDESLSSMLHGHSWSVEIQEADGSASVSCTECHSDIVTPADAHLIIDLWQASFQSLEATVEQDVAAATLAMDGVVDPALQAKLEEAQHNLEYAQGDESGGFHNHNYQMALLNDAEARAQEILAALP